jgi:Tfp pilus assembly protein PilE
VNQYVKTEISALIDRLPSDCPHAVNVEKLKVNRTQVQSALEYLAEKQERGFNMDVRAGEPVESPTEVEAETAELKRIQKESRRLREITRKSAEMKVLERQAAPILTLTNPGTEGQESKS